MFPSLHFNEKHTCFCLLQLSTLVSIKTMKNLFNYLFELQFGHCFAEGRLGVVRFYKSFLLSIFYEERC